MSQDYEIKCPKCSIKLRVEVSEMGVAGGKMREEGHCPKCLETVAKYSTSGFIRVTEIN